MTEVLAALCSCPDAATARQLAKCLVERRLAACVNILPEVRSIYRWGGELQEDQEALMVIKTTGLVYREMESWLLEHHPYEVPEVLALTVPAGSADYLDWVLNEVGAR